MNWLRRLFGWLRISESPPNLAAEADGSSRPRELPPARIPEGADECAAPEPEELSVDWDRELVHPYESFFFDFGALGEKPTPTAVRKFAPQGSLREEVFKKLSAEFPDRPDYHYEYVEARSDSGIYDAADFAECFAKIDQGLALPEKGASHRKLARIRAKIEKQKREYDEEVSEELEHDKRGLGWRYRSGDHEAIMRDFEELRAKVKPIGIIGGDEERSMWGYWLVTIEIHLDRENPKEAFRLLGEYEQGRIAVSATPLPDYAVQEKVLGYLAQHSVKKARARLGFWLANNKAGSVSELIKHNQAFADLFPPEPESPGPNY